MNRRKYLKQLITAASIIPFIQTPIFAMQNEKMLTRAIPSSGEKLPVVGIGTWQTFDVNTSESEREPLKKVLEILINHGGSVIDSSPMYGRSEAVVGDLSSELGLTDKLFMATKVWITGEKEGIQQMERSMNLMQKKVMDLMQIHNLVDWKTHLKTLRSWKETGKIRYIGITHYTDSAYNQMAQIIKDEPIDFIQIDYSINNTNSDNLLLPLAREKGIAVLINRPYDGGSLFRMVRGKTLPSWTSDLDINSWGQYFLKYILGNEAVTCVIPGTAKPEHMIDNVGAGIGRLPDKKDMEKMKKWLENQ